MLLGTLADFYRATPSSISGKFHCANSNMNRQEIITALVTFILFIRIFIFRNSGSKKCLPEYHLGEVNRRSKGDSTAYRSTKS